MLPASVPVSMHPVSPIPHDLAVKLRLIRPDSTLIPIGFWRDRPSTDPAKTAAGREAARYRKEVEAIDAGERGPTVHSSRGVESFRDHAAHQVETKTEQALLESLLPWPGDHVDAEMPEAERGRVAALLDAAPVMRRDRGSSWDRLDPSNTRNGSAERWRGGYVWPSGLSHYVRKYGLRLPAEFLIAITPARPGPADVCTW